VNKILRYRIKNKIRSLLTGKKVTDDFDWELYPEHYQGELDNIAKTCLQVLAPGDYFFKDGMLLQDKDTPIALHPNHQLLYETILQIAPMSVMEIGCGGGDHLKNISLLLPQTKMYGRDISQKQMDFARERHNELNAELDQLDVTLPLPLDYPIVDIVYTQAVIQHIKTSNAHIVALANLFRIAEKQVILMENWSCHDFKRDIEFLFNRGILPWENLYIYYREAGATSKTRIMIVSAVKLTNYSELKDYSLFTG
jgi:ubiquinone/menaquinone biosynthesis C-methylase UbiE